jgi:serine/threonine protein kinase
MRQPALQKNFSMSDQEAHTELGNDNALVSGHDKSGAALPELVPEVHGLGAAWSDLPPHNFVDDPLIGVTLSGTYRIVRVLGEGGMGRVYEAHHTRITKKRYAIKVLHPEFAQNADVLARFQREAEAAACLSHPAAVSVFDVARTPQGWPYLVCEHLTGLDLSELLKKHGPLSVTTAQHIAFQVCDALVEAHANGVIHRDLKPQNVFVMGDFSHGIPEHPNAKVLDFGLSRLSEEKDGNQLTRTGVILGTPSYMSPEQARGDRMDHRTDVYGVGALLYTILTGQPPFAHETPQATMIAVMNDEPVRPTKINPHIPPQVELVVQRAMDRDLKQRYPDMVSLRNALEHLIGSSASALAEAPRSAYRNALATLHNEASSSRLTLLSLGLAALGLMLVSVAAGVAGAVLLKYQRWPLTRVETILSALVLLGTLLTPSILWVRWFRRRVWGNTARVVEVLGRVRECLHVGLLTYGVGALGVLFYDTVIAEARSLTFNTGRTWPGVAPLLLLCAAVMASATIGRGLLNTSGGWATRAGGIATSRLRRILAGPLLSWVAALILTGMFVTLLAQRERAVVPTATKDAHVVTATTAPSQTQPAMVPPPVTAQPSATSERANVAPQPSQTPTATVEPTPSAQTTRIEAASASELRTAVAQGLQAGLLPLAQTYPQDPAVLRALAMAQASSSATLRDAMATLKRLFALEPHAADEVELQHIVVQTTRNPSASSQALELLAHGMPGVGTDLLFKIALTENEPQRESARKLLTKPAIRATFSQALAVAYDLQYAPSCAVRVSMLERAKTYGDERSTRSLNALSRGAKRGCGFLSRQACKPACPVQAAQFLATVEAINARLAKEKAR